MRSYLILCALFLSASPPAFAENDPAPSRGAILRVHGTGKSEQKPNLARFDVIVTTKDKTLDAVVEAHKARATKALTALRDLVPSGLIIESSRFSIDEERRPAYAPPIYAGQPAPPTPTISTPPFLAKTWFSLKVVSIENLNDIMTRLAGSGLFLIQKVSFKVENERGALNAARRSALIDAQEQAQTYAETGNLKLVEIIEVTDGEAQPSNVGEADLPRARFVQIVPPAVITFDASVNVTWRIAPK